MNIEELKQLLTESEINFSEKEVLAPYTTWKVGGIADIFVNIKTTEQLVLSINAASKTNTPVTILGWGSNVLISDDGIRGLVIKNQSNNIEFLDENIKEQVVSKVKPRLIQAHPEEYYSFNDIDYDESSSEQTNVYVDSGVGLPLLINILISKGITGLQWFSGIPGTIGGAVFNNIHGGKHFISEYVSEVEILDKEGNVKKISNNDINFNYDYSRFHETKEVILRIKLTLYKGDKERAKHTSITWAQKKKLQPANSAGCCFQNIQDEEKNKLNLESNSWGYIIDKVLNLKGKTSGKAKISPHHAAFIETEPGAKAKDILSLFELIYASAESVLGITPKPEIFFLGFSESQISKYK